MSDIEFLHPDHEKGLPLSKGAVAGDFMYTFGDGEVFDEQDPKPGMRKVFERTAALLAEKGLTLADVVKTTVLLSRENVWTEYSEVYREYFKKPFPVRTTIPVVHEVAFIELDLVAYKKGLSDCRQVATSQVTGHR